MDLLSICSKKLVIGNMESIETFYLPGSPSFSVSSILSRFSSIRCRFSFQFSRPCKRPRILVQTFRYLSSFRLILFVVFGSLKTRNANVKKNCSFRSNLKLTHYHCSVVCVIQSEWMNHKPSKAPATRSDRTLRMQSKSASIGSWKPWKIFEYHYHF